MKFCTRVDNHTIASNIRNDFQEFHDVIMTYYVDDSVAL